MTERLSDIRIASGHELDAWAREFGVEPRRNGEPHPETDAVFRDRIITTYRARMSDFETYMAADIQPSGPTAAEIGTAVHQAIESWKTARELPYLSPSACKLLNDLIVAGLRPVLGGRRVEPEIGPGLSPFDPLNR